MRNLSVALAAEIAKPDATYFDIVRITPVRGKFPLPQFGVSTVDADVEYQGLLFSASSGVELSAIESTASTEVATAEAKLLIGTEQSGVTEQQALAGLLDYAIFEVIRIVPTDPDGSGTLMLSGTLGEVEVTEDGQVLRAELRSLRQQLLRSIVQPYSRTCRAVFGSMPGDPGVRFPCNFDASVLWFNASVASVDPAEPQRTMTYSGTTFPDGGLVPGKVEFLTGDNAGFTVEIEAQTGNTVSLAHEAPFPITAGNTLRIRDECGKRYKTDCIDRFNNQQNFRGEPFLTGADEGTANSPAASLPPANPAPPPPEPATIPTGNPVVIDSLDFEGDNSGWELVAGSPATFAVESGPLADTGTFYGRITAPLGMQAQQAIIWSKGAEVLPGSTIRLNGRVRIFEASAGSAAVSLAYNVSIASPTATDGFAGSVTWPVAGQFGVADSGWQNLTEISNQQIPAAVASPIWLRVGVVVANRLSQTGTVDVLIDNFTVEAIGP